MSGDDGVSGGGGGGVDGGGAEPAGKSGWWRILLALGVLLSGVKRDNDNRIKK